MCHKSFAWKIFTHRRTFPGISQFSKVFPVLRHPVQYYRNGLTSPVDLTTIFFLFVDHTDFIYYSGYEQLPERTLLLHGRIQPDKLHTGCLCFGDNDVTIPCVVSIIKNSYNKNAFQ